MGVLVGNVQRIFIPDMHVPYMDMNAWEEVLAFVIREHPLGATFLGDGMDCYTVSRYDKSPGRPSLLQEANEMKERLRQFMSYLRSTDVDYVEGNHEQRLRKYIMRHAPELSGLEPTIPGILGLADLGIRWVPWGVPNVVDGVWTEHGDCSGSKSGYTAHKMLTKRGVRRGVSAHTHKLALVHINEGTQPTRQWAEAGSLCLTAPMEYTIYPDWQRGFVWLDMQGNLHTEVLS